MYYYYLFAYRDLFYLLFTLFIEIITNTYNELIYNNKLKAAKAKPVIKE